MASIIPVGNKFRAQIRRAGQPTLTKTHATEKAAKDWAILEESKIITGIQTGVIGTTGMTVANIVDRYLKEKKDLGASATCNLLAFRSALGKIVLQKLTAKHIVDYLQKKQITPGSVAVHFSYIRSVLVRAKVVWEYYVPNIIDDARIKLKADDSIGKSVERTRRPSPREIDMLLQYNYQTPMPMAEIIKFAISTAMRQSEITRICHATFDENQRTILITDRKHPKKKKDNHQTVPLLEDSVAIIKRQPHLQNDDRVFPFRAQTVGEYFRKACKSLGIVDLHFHDLRHEGTSRLFEMGYQAHEVQLFTGHEDLKMLMRYTHLKAEGVRRIDLPKVELLPSMDTETAKQFAQFQMMMAMMKQKEAAQ